MIQLLKNSFLLILLLCVCSCKGQTREEIENHSADFDKSPPIYYKMPLNLSSRDTCPGWDLEGQKILLTGTVYKSDGKTPVSNAILYYYQTDPEGRYPTKTSEARNMPPNNLGQTHGYLRGWIKTDQDGKYAIYTVKPGSYPSRAEAAHIHVYVKDPQMEQPYYIDNFVFDMDPLLTADRRKKMENRGGSGVIRFIEKKGLQIGERNIILGLNIPNYPKPPFTGLNSGKNIGEEVLSFTPFHAYGPDKGSKACPVCKYGWYHGILYFVGNHPNWTEIKKWLTFLEMESHKRKKYLKVYFVYGNETNYNYEQRIALLEKLGNELLLTQLALTFVPSFSDKTSEIFLNNINPEVKNTFLIYKRNNIIGKYVDLNPSPENFIKISTRLDQTINEYFHSLRPW